MTHHSLVAGVLATLIGLSGCTALSKMGQVAMDPSIPVGPTKDQPTEVAFSINASPTLNSNPNSVDVAVEQEISLEPSPTQSV